MLREFKEFAMRGNVMDLAIGVIIGGAFGKIISSLVDEILMPPLGLLLSNVDFTNLYLNLSGGKYTTLAEAKAAGAVTISYGVFLNAVLDFVIVAFVVFMLVKQINRLQPKQAVPAPPPSEKECPYCLSSIPLKATRCPHCTSQLN